MGIFRSFYRYIVTLGGLIGGDIDSRTDAMLTTPTGIKATFEKTREQWTRQYGEVREAVAQLMLVLSQKRRQVDALKEEAKDVKIKMKGAVEQYKKTQEPRYQEAFTDLFNRDKAIAAQQEGLDKEIGELHEKVNQYREKLKEMQGRIQELKKQESEAIADIVSSQQIIKLNDSLNSISMDLDDRNLQSINERREALRNQAELSDQMAETEVSRDLEKELVDAGMKSEAADVFAAMLAEREKGEEGGETKDTDQPERQRNL
jgi:phage shock protein A